jgi:hypothetical protein
VFEPIVRAYVLGSTSLSDASWTGNDDIFGVRPELLVEGNIQLELFAPMSFEEVYGGIHLNRWLVFLRLAAVSKQRNSSSFVPYHHKLFVPGREPSQENSLSGSVAPDDVNK